MNRLQSLSTQLSPTSPDDIVICGAVRTPLTKAKRGPLKDTPPQLLLSTVLKSLAQTLHLNPAHIQDIAVGNNLQPGAGQKPARMAQFLAGYPHTTPIVSVNRLCSSGLEACAMIAGKIRLGTIDIGVGCGVESMSVYDMSDSVNVKKLSEEVGRNQEAKDCLVSMGITSENVAERFGVTRQKQDQMAVDSHRKAYNAQAQGLFKEEIVPVVTKYKDKDGNWVQVTVTQDDGIRKDTTLSSLSKLKPAFKQCGTTTAGNSSQMTDGAAAVLLARRSTAQSLNLPILAKWLSYSVVGVPPNIMGIGPAVAIPVALSKAGLSISDIDIFEINEAFASQAVYCCEKLGIDMEKVNPKGGAIALGHPLGCTGARQIATLLPEMRRRNGRYAVVSMCIGTGMGAAAVIQRE